MDKDSILNPESGMCDYCQEKPWKYKHGLLTLLCEDCIEIGPVALDRSPDH